MYNKTKYIYIKNIITKSNMLYPMCKKFKGYRLLCSDVISILSCAFDCSCFVTHGVWMFSVFRKAFFNKENVQIALEHHLNIIQTSPKHHQNISINTYIYI